MRASAPLQTSRQPSPSPSPASIAGEGTLKIRTGICLNLGDQHYLWETVGVIASTSCNSTAQTVRPPSMATIEPVMYRPSSEATKAINAATSAGSLMPSGVRILASFCGSTPSGRL